MEETTKHLISSNPHLSVKLCQAKPWDPITAPLMTANHNHVHSICKGRFSTTKQGTVQWFSETKGSIGGSSIAKALGHEKYMENPYDDLIDRLCGKSEPLKVALPLVYGHRFEPLNRSLLTQIVGSDCFVYGTYKKTPIEHFSPDGIMLVGKDLVLAEFKTPISRSVVEWKMTISDGYIDQMNWSMRLMEDIKYALFQDMCLKFLPESSLLNVPKRMFNGQYFNKRLYKDKKPYAHVIKYMHYPYDIDKLLKSGKAQPLMTPTKCKDGRPMLNLATINDNDLMIEAVRDSVPVSPWFITWTPHGERKIQATREMLDVNIEFGGKPFEDRAQEDEDRDPFLVPNSYFEMDVMLLATWRVDRDDELIDSMDKAVERIVVDVDRKKRGISDKLVVEEDEDKGEDKSEDKSEDKNE